MACTIDLGTCTETEIHNYPHTRYMYTEFKPLHTFKDSHTIAHANALSRGGGKGLVNISNRTDISVNFTTSLIGKVLQKLIPILVWVAKIAILV